MQNSQLGREEGEKFHIFSRTQKAMSSAESERTERNLGRKEKKVEKQKCQKKIMSLPGIFDKILRSEIMNLNENKLGHW